MHANTMFFTAPGQVELRQTPLPPLTQGQMLIETICSAISPGTEMLFYHGEIPNGLTDPNDSVSSGLQYPMPYGYAAVGRVVKISKDMRHRWKDKLVFAFQPHASHFIAKTDEVIPLPDGMSPENACFLANMETAVNLVQDGAPLLGERVFVFGQGVIGLLTAALLNEFPLQLLVSSDCYRLRRRASSDIGVTECIDPDEADFQKQATIHNGYDLTYELSGSPSALNDAITLTGFGGRVVIGSWYGEKQTTLNLGRNFHRSRIKLISSQVSTISPCLTARWDKARRFSTVWDALEHLQPQKWITHHIPFEQAGEAYQLLDNRPEDTIQVVFKYAD